MSDHPSFDSNEGEDFLQLGFDIFEVDGEDQADQPAKPEQNQAAKPEENRPARPQAPKPRPQAPGSVPYRPTVGTGTGDADTPSRPAMPKAPAPGKPAPPPPVSTPPPVTPRPAPVSQPAPPPPPPVSEIPEENILAQHILSREEMVEPAEEKEENPETAQVRRLTGALAKAVKAAQLYPVENPMCRKFAQELMARINETFQAIDVIRLSVGKNKLFFAGDPVLEQEGRDESVPGRLFWAGLREISFHVGLTGEEVLAFLSTFRNDGRESIEGEGDMVTRLWDAHFEHVTYIAVDDLLDLQNADDPIPAEFGNDFMNFVDLDMHNLEDEEETERLSSDMAEQIRQRMNKEDPTLFGITQEERDALLAEIAEEESPKMLHDILGIIFETLLLETDDSSFMELVQVMSGAMLALLGEGRLGEAAEVISMLQRLKHEGAETLSPARETVVDSGIAAAFDQTRRVSLISHLDSSRREALEALDHFVAALPDVAIEPLCDVLGELKTPAASKRLVQALSAKARGDIQPFLPYLRDTRSELVRKVAGILGESQNEAGVEPLKKLLRHPEFYVRRDGLKALSQLGSGQALDVLSDALLDVDPRIRMTAARSLGSAGRVAIPALLTSIEDSEFDLRPLTEKRAFYEALGFAGGEDVIPVFKRALKRKGWFKRAQVEEIQACACEALGWVGTEEARKLLTEQLKAKSVLVRTAAQSGLRRMLSGEGGDLMKEAA